MGDKIPLDRQFPETNDTVVKSNRNMYRYQKKMKSGIDAKGRKNGRFFKRSSLLPAGCRRD